VISGGTRRMGMLVGLEKMKERRRRREKKM
jgi:hypothetical protein